MAYIDRDKLLKEIEDVCAPYGQHQMIKDEIIDIIKAMPEEDGIHGEWDVHEDEGGIYGICSVCGIAEDFTHTGERYPICPHCGAKMDLI